jgi:large subunit ribosomal protein L15
VKLHDLQPSSGSHEPSRRVGRGHGSGRGKTAGRGTKGQKSRAGGGIPAWFEGGQTPLHIRTPKLHGFKNRFRVEYAGVNLARLTEAAAGTLITPDVLKHDGLLRDRKTRQLPVKILGGGDAPKGVTIHAHAFTRSALAKLSAAGSTAQRISWPEGNPVDEAAEAAEAASIEARDSAKADARARGKAKRKAARGGAPAPSGAPAKGSAATATVDTADAEAESADMEPTAETEPAEETEPTAAAEVAEETEPTAAAEVAAAAETTAEPQPTADAESEVEP